MTASRRRAAAAQGFYDNIGHALEECQDGAWPEKLPVAHAFKEACARFIAAGFRFGDPTTYLHDDPNHPHMRKPDFENCKHCAPPVHGEVVLLKLAADGAVREYDAASIEQLVREAEEAREARDAADDDAWSFFGEAPAGAGAKKGGKAGWLRRGKYGWAKQLTVGLVFLLSAMVLSTLLLLYSYGMV